MENNNTILHRLSTSFLFRGLKITDLQELAKKSKLQKYSPRHIVIEEELVNDRVFLILEGLVKVYKLTTEGKEVFIAFEKEHNYLGVMDLEEKPASATVETLSATNAIVFNKKDLIKILEKNPHLWQRMYAIVLAKLEEMKHLQGIRLGNDLSTRTYLLLQFLSRFSLDKSVRLSQETLAGIVGATRPRVTEALHVLQDSRKITVSPKKVIVL